MAVLYISYAKMACHELKTKLKYLSIYWCLKNKLYANILLLIYGYLHENEKNDMGQIFHIISWKW